MSSGNALNIYLRICLHVLKIQINIIWLLKMSINMYVMKVTAKPFLFGKKCFYKSLFPHYFGNDCTFTCPLSHLLDTLHGLHVEAVNLLLYL